MKNIITIIVLLFCLSICPAMAQKSTDSPGQVIGTTFPEISGDSLSGQKVVLPQAAMGNVTLVLISVKRDSVQDLDPWLKAFSEAFDKNTGFTYYKIPMIRAPFLKQMSSMINGQMKKDTPEEHHDRVVTYFGPVESYVKALGITDEEKGYAFILDKKGVIKWKSSCSDDQGSIKEMIRVSEDLVK